MQRAYSLLTIKTIDEDQRVITGIATTPRADRMDDIVEPEGAVFNLPLPFLWQHNSREPVGHVTKAKITKAGIEVRVELVKFDEPGDLKNLLDKAWGMIKTGLVRGLSIGFSPIESANIEGSWGQRFLKWDWLELSGVTIPANEEATIQTIKSHDTGAPAATGTAARVTKSPGASGPVKAITSKPGAGTVKTKITEQIKQWENTRAANQARIDELMAKSAETGETLDDAEEQEYDELQAKNAKVDAHLVRLRAQEAANVEAAKTVDGTTTEKATASRGGSIVVHAAEKLEPGIEFARFAMCLAAAKGDVPRALALAKTHYPQQERAIGFLRGAELGGMSVEKFFEHVSRIKAAVPAGTTTDATWALPLLAYNTFSGDFLEFLRPQTIIGQFGQGGKPDLRRIPFNVHIKGQTSGGTAYWVGQGKAKPVTKYDFIDAYHGWAKLAAIAVLTEELIRFSDPSAERLVRDALAGTIVAKSDTDFIDPAVAAVANISPASITNGVAAITSSGTTADDVSADIAALMAVALAANLPLSSAVFVTTPTIALAVSLMKNALGQREFPDMGLNGGTLAGIPTIVSNYVPAGLVVLVFASEIYLSDDNQVTIDASREASIQMLDNPTNASDGATVPTTLVSMFQTNSVALRAERFINWSKRRASAVAVLEDVEWGGFGS